MGCGLWKASCALCRSLVGGRVEGGLDQWGLQRAPRSTDTKPVPCPGCCSSLSKGWAMRVENEDKSPAHNSGGPDS